MLLGILGPTANSKQQRDGVFALLALKKKAVLSPMVAAPFPPPPQVCDIVCQYAQVFSWFVD